MDIYCTTIKYYKVMDKLPYYIKPLGLGDVKYPPNWLQEKLGKNISNLNKYYAEFTGFYWIWKTGHFLMPSTGLPRWVAQISIPMGGLLGLVFISLRFKQQMKNASQANPSENGSKL